MTPGVWVVVTVAVVLVALAGLSQVLAYRREGSVITSTQLVLRLVMGALLLVVLGLALWGIPRLVAPLPGLTHEQQLSALRRLAAFWTLIIGLVVVVAGLALADLRHLRAGQRRARAEMYRNLARVQEELRTRAEAPPEAGQCSSEE